MTNLLREYKDEEEYLKKAKNKHSCEGVETKDLLTGLTKAFKPFIVTRHSDHGGCQVLFPLHLLDAICQVAVAYAVTERDLREKKGK